MDWAGIAQRIGTATDIIGGKKSYTDVKLDQAAVMDRRAKMAMDAHNVARAEQYDLDKERMRAAREWDLQKYSTGAAKDLQASNQQFQEAQASRAYFNNLLRDAANNQARLQQMQLRSISNNPLDRPITPAWRVALGGGIPEDATGREVQAYGPVITSNRQLTAEQVAADTFEANRKARAEAAARNTIGARIGRFFGYGEAPATGTTNAPAGDNY